MTAAAGGPGPPSRAVAAYFGLHRGLAVLAGLLIVLGSALISADVLAYNLFHRPLGWPSDVVRYIFLLSLLLPAATALLTNSHIRVTLIVERFGPRSFAAMSAIGFLISVSYLALLCWYSGFFFVLSIERGWVSMMSYVPIPLAYLYGGMVVGSALLVIASVVRLLVELGRIGVPE